MPSGFLKALKKVGLIDVDEPVDAASAVSDASPPSAQASVARAATSAPAEEPLSADLVSADIVESIPLEQIYADGQVPSCPYPAEKLLKVLAGLKAMDVGTRRAAIAAMDAADDSWRIEDVLLDAECKIKALQTRKKMLAAQAQASDAEAAARVSEREAQQQQALDNVRKQIADLQALMEREVAKATADKAAALAKAQSTRGAGTRETLRLDQEIERLREISTTFAATPPAR
jgi:hypothetical protein